MNKENSQFSKHLFYLSSLLSLNLALACGSSNPSDPLTVEPEGEITETPCDSNAACNDGLFCNGTETCDNGFCRLGVAPRCDDGIECTKDVCSHKTSSCQFLPPDEDADGHADANCTSPDGEALGDDCDDEDANRYPGNTEICSKEDPSHDEDCDAKTYGTLDEDTDGATSDSCCNEDADGESNCGLDCDDDDYRRNHDYPEICDDLDNDCDGKIDKNTKEVLWYPDADGDHFGTESDDAILSCAPVENRSLRPSDCDDQESAVHIAAREECDGVDNDCDGEVDEEGVCACAPQGNARPCSCGGSLTGIQVCDGGLWNSCDCSECVTGSTDCVGELLPRECVAGRWQVRPACRGIRPICIEGQCLCADGSDDCIEIADIFRPYVKDSVPLGGSVNTPAGASLAVEFSENIAPASAASAVVLTDSLGTVLSGTVSVGGSTLYFVPDEPLGAGQAYQFHVESSVTDLAGNALLVHSPVNFRTMAGLVASRVGEGNTRILSEPVLAVNEDGDALLLATNSAAAGYPGAPPYTTAHTFEETKFVGGGVVSFGTQDFRIAFDDSQQFLIGETNNTEHAVYFLNNNGNVMSESLSNDATLASTPVFANPTGAAMAIFSSGSELQVATGTISGFNNAFTLPNSGDYIDSIAGDVGDSGRGIVAFRNNNVHVYHSDENLENWQAASANPAFIDILNLSVVLTTNNVATVAWSGWTSGGSQGNAYQIFTQSLASDGEWIGSPVQPRGEFNSGHEMSPLLVADSNDNLVLSYVRGTQLIAITRTQGGSWGDETIFNSATDLYVHAPRLKMARSGEAVLGWISHSAQPGTIDLWVARYSPQTGWRPARLVEDETSNITAFDLGIDANGRVFVVYTASDTEDALWVTL